MMLMASKKKSTPLYSRNRKVNKPEIEHKIENRIEHEIENEIENGIENGIENEITEAQIIERNYEIVEAPLSDEIIEAPLSGVPSRGI